MGQLLAAGLTAGSEQKEGASVGISDSKEEKEEMSIGGQREARATLRCIGLSGTAVEHVKKKEARYSSMTLAIRGDGGGDRLQCSIRGETKREGMEAEGGTLGL